MTTWKTISQSLAGLAASAVLALGLAESASAFTLITDPIDDLLVTGILDLNVGGDLYDIAFKQGSFNDAFGNVGDLTTLEGNEPLFWGNRDGGIALAKAVAAALGTDYYTLEQNGRLYDSILVPYDSGGSRYSNVVVSVYELINGLEVDTIRYGLGSSLTGDVTSGLTYMWVTANNNNDATPVPEPTSMIAILAVVGTGMLATRKCKK